MDWPAFFDQYSVDWFRATRTNITIRCPWCGDDPSHHLSVSLQGKGYHCWRNHAHAGRQPHQLIMAVTGCSFDQAQRIVEQGSAMMRLSDENFADAVSKLLGAPAARRSAEGRSLGLLPEFRSMFSNAVTRRVFVPYLRRRGYTDEEIEYLESRFSLCCALDGAFAYRIIIPVFVSGKLVSWTARTVTDDRLRYKTLSTDAETAAKADLPVAALSIKQTLYDHDHLMRGGDTLVITEGPFDALRVSFFGEPKIRATCLFGKSVSREQHALIDQLRHIYKRVILLTDADVGWSMFGVLPDWVEIKQLPSSVNDPAELDYKQFCQVFEL